MTDEQRPPRVLLLGAGLMGAQIACEYAWASIPLTVASRDVAAARERIAAAALRAAALGIGGGDPVGTARDGIRLLSDPLPHGPFDVVVESLPENLDLKVRALRPLVDAWPDATVATNTSSLGVASLGVALGATERTLAAHYLNPAMLMPVVELVAPPSVTPGHVHRVEQLLRRMGKDPVRVGDVPGFVINRLQFALLRECAWLVDQGVADPDAIDRIVRDGLARRWALTGPYETAALGGASTFRRIAANLFPALAGREQPGTLPGIPTLSPDDAGAVAADRDERLARWSTTDRTTG